jgi:hypothetical protein
MDRLPDTSLLGCSHTYCERCITQWVTRKARCPICSAPVRGLLTESGDVVYLSPHDARGWGVVVQAQHHIADRSIVRIAHVEENSVCADSGLREDNLIRVCRKDGSYVRGAKAIRRSAKLAFLEKRMLRVERVGSLMSREAPEQIAQIGCLAAARQVCRGVSCYF